MRLFPTLLAASGIGAAMLGTGSQQKTWTLVVTGGIHGYLSPCGCTKPMSGGILRRATAIKSLAAGSQVAYIDSGELVSSRGRQDEIKAETLALAMKRMGVGAIALGPIDLALGSGVTGSVQRLSGDKAIDSDVTGNEIPSAIQSGPFWVGTLDAPLSPANLQAVKGMEAEARKRQLLPALVVHGSRDTAREIARQFSGLKLVVYSSIGSPPEALEEVGQTSLISPGDKGRFVLTAKVSNNRISQYRAIELGPQFPDDPSIAEVYREYQQRVRDEKLLDRLVRRKTALYAGTSACLSCHASAAKAWNASRHSIALKTLESDGHDRDPDCAGCHVTGLESNSGFTSRQKTPQLANVGCENCHGPSLDHSKTPLKIKTPSIAKDACRKCHDETSSPSFNFEKYWEKIRHG